MRGSRYVATCSSLRDPGGNGDPAAKRNPELPRLPIQIRALHPERARRLAHLPSAVTKHRRDVIALELPARLAQVAARTKRRTVQLDLGEHFLLSDGGLGSR